jgi:hypothetical protein
MVEMVPVNFDRTSIYYRSYAEVRTVDAEAIDPQGRASRRLRLVGTARSGRRIARLPLSDCRCLKHLVQR